MELGLTLGDQSASSPFIFLPKQHKQQQHSMSKLSNGNGILKNRDKICGLGLGICMSNSAEQNDDIHMVMDMDMVEDDDDHTTSEEDDDDDDQVNGDDHRDVSSFQQLDLLPLLSLPPRSPSSSSYNNNNHRNSSGKGFHVNSLRQLGGGGGSGSGGGCGAGTACEVTSANSVASSTTRFPMDFDLLKGGGGGNLSSHGGGGGGGTEGKDDDEDETCINGVNAKKKLRLSKEQSAFLEESFKEHHTLNPKQKLALAKQLNLRPRQIEVWFQNRRARTKLKQTEVDCEYLKRCCETLTEENKRLHKELQELRVLKTSSNNPFYMQVPATTLTMCSSCEKITTTSTPPPTTTTTNPATAVSATNHTTTTTTKAIPFPLSKSTRHALPFSSKNN